MKDKILSPWVFQTLVFLIIVFSICEAYSQYILSEGQAYPYNRLTDSQIRAEIQDQILAEAEAEARANAIAQALFQVQGKAKPQARPKVKNRIQDEIDVIKALLEAQKLTELKELAKAKTC